MKTSIPFVVLALLSLSARAESLGTDQIECTVSVGQQRQTKSAEIASAVQGAYVSDTLVGNATNAYTSYSLAVNGLTSTVEFSAGGAKITGQLLPGEKLSWDIFDTFGGPDENVVCRRGGELAQMAAANVSCKLKQVHAAGVLGEDPTVVNHPSVSGNLADMSTSLHFGENDEFAESSVYSTFFQTHSATVLLGDYSDHVLDEYVLPLAQGRGFAVRAAAGDGSYEDFTCRAE